MMASATAAAAGGGSTQSVSSGSSNTAPPPPSFANSFWTPDFNLEPLLAKVHAGTVENQEILRFVADRANASNETARALFAAAELGLSKKGFNVDEGASLRRTVEGLKYETGQVAKAHETVANNLDHMVIRPFTTWSSAHSSKVSDITEQVQEAVKDWEGFSGEVRKLKEARNVKSALAEEAEEDLRFAPTSPGSTVGSAGANAPTSSGSSSRVRSDSAASAAATHAASVARDTANQAAQAAQHASLAATNLARNFSQRMRVSPTASAVKARFDRMRIEAREKELAAKGRETSDAILEEEELVDEEGTALPRRERRDVVEGEKKAGLGLLAPAAELASTTARQTKIDELEIGRITKHPKDWSIIFSKAKAQIQTTAVKVPLMGTTPDAHSGEDLVLWFRDNLDDLRGSISRSHEFCRQLSEELSILRLVGEIGNKFFDSSDAYYAWRPEAFHLEDVQREINEAAGATSGESAADGEVADRLTQLPAPLREKRSSNSPLMSPKMRPQSPPSVPEKDGSSSGATPLSPSSGSTTAAESFSSPSASSGLSRSNTISSYLSSAYEKAASNVTSLNARMGKIAASTDRIDRLRRDADEAEEVYRVAVRELEELRMQLEELTASSLARLQKLETDRMKAIKSVITTYNATVASLNTPLQLSSERSALLGEAFLPGHDINSIIERYRTGPFRPRPAVWTDFYHEETDVRFGVDLRHWRDTHDTKEQTPDVYAVLLSALDESYKRAASDEDRRKTWIYEVPLLYTHRLRNLVNSSASPIQTDEVKRFDGPVLASGVKLYLLELAVSLIPSALYSDIKALYPSVGADTVDLDARTASILSLLERVPKIHLVVLDALLSHLNSLISGTKSQEADADFITKLGHSLGPCILRPAVESGKTLNDRFPAQFFSDMLRNYSAILPPTLEKKSKVEEERYAPKRQRTKMVDQRLTRSNASSNNATAPPVPTLQTGGLSVVGDAAHQIMQSPASTLERGKDWLKQELEKRTGQKAATSPERTKAEAEPTLPEAPLPAIPAEATPTESQGSSAVPAVAVSGRGPEDGEQAESLLIPPAPALATSDDEGGAASPGFVTPTEEVAPQLQSQPAASQPTAEEAAPMSASTAATAAPAKEGTSGTAEEDDLDKPLVGNVALQRSTTGASARRIAPARGPRPMSMQGPAGGAGAAGLGAAGVRARAAMFEQKSGDGSAAPSGRGHRSNASLDTATSPRQ